MKSILRLATLYLILSLLSTGMVIFRIFTEPGYGESGLGLIVLANIPISIVVFFISLVKFLFKKHRKDQFPLPSKEAFRSDRLLLFLIISGVLFLLLGVVFQS